jgi:hypothetical protein
MPQTLKKKNYGISVEAQIWQSLLKEMKEKIVFKQIIFPNDAPQ